MPELKMTAQEAEQDFWDRQKKEVKEAEAKAEEPEPKVEKKNLSRGQVLLDMIEGAYIELSAMHFENLTAEELKSHREKTLRHAERTQRAEIDAPKDPLKDPATFRFLSNYDASKNQPQQKQIMEKLIRIYGANLAVAGIRPSEFTQILSQPRNHIDPEVKEWVDRTMGFKARLEPNQTEM